MSGQLWYSLFNFLGFTAAFITAGKMKITIHEKLTSQQKTLIFAGLVCGVIAGAKLPHLILNGFRLESLLKGKSILTALIGAYFSVNLIKRFAGIKGYYGDKYVLPICVAVAISKIGCLLNGCCGGKETSFFLSIKTVTGQSVHPTQIYCIIFHILLIPLFLYLYRRNILPGIHFILYLILYTFYRFFIEFIRVEPVVFHGFTLYQIFAAGGFFYFLFEFYKRTKLEENLNSKLEGHTA